MNDDVRRIVYGTLIGFLLIVVSWLALIYISACGFTLTCYRALPIVVRTPIPTLIPVAHAENQGGEPVETEFNECRVSATDLVGAWVIAGSPETEAFPFTDLDGSPCEGTYVEDVQPLFIDSSVWYPGSLGCVSCHNVEQPDRNGGLDLTTYQGILQGAQNKDILGGGDWESSILRDVLLVHGFVLEGHSADAEPLAPVVLYAGQRAAEAEVTATPTP